LIPYISCKSISKSHGSKDLFEDLSVNLHSGDRIGLIGPNGAGKSTLLHLLAKRKNPDEGEVVTNKNVRIGFVSQEMAKYQGSVIEVLDQELGLAPHLDEFKRENYLRQLLGLVGIQNPEQKASELSGGWGRRLSIAKALVHEPNVLLMDEPTNHLDLDTILWLEGFLKRSVQTFIITSHDRVFLDNICNKIWEISSKYPKGIFISEGGFAEFNEARETFLQGQKQYQRGLQSKVSREEEWLKSGVKARTTKSRARIQETARLQHELARVKFRNSEKKIDFALNATESQTKKLLVGKNLSKHFGDKTIFSKVDVRLMREDRLAIVGENGSGKTTLLKILAREIESDTGTLKEAGNLKVFYFDQNREQLDLNLSLKKALSPYSDTIEYRGKSVHVNSWCEKFLFDKTLLELPIKCLSGGERARLLIARLMLHPVDILLLDEPTNDLDIDTLKILEESLDDFPGSVVLVSHDRAFVDRVCDQLLMLEEKEGYTLFNDTEGWLEYRDKQKKCIDQKKKTDLKKQSEKKGGLSYKEKQELDGIEKYIDDLSKEIDALHMLLEDPMLQVDSDAFTKTCQEIGRKEKEVDQAYERWHELEERLKGPQDSTR
jgi:ATP-binding cassette subfamily F protein uup